MRTTTVGYYLSANIRTILSTGRTTLLTHGASSQADKLPMQQNTDEVEVKAWIKSIRAHKNVAFIELNDGSSAESLQGVLKGGGKAEGMTNGTSVKLRGRLQQSKGQGQDVELVVDEAMVLGVCDSELYPIQKKALPAALLRENAHLRFRTTQTAAIMRIRDALARDWHDWFEEHNFIHIHTPILTGSDCEGVGEVFTIHDHPPPSNPTAPEPFFPHPTHLTVSSQLHLEAPTLALSRTYTLSPSFRAEPSMTSRHLSEFYMLEAELAWEESLDGLLNIVEGGIRDVVQKASGQCWRSKRMREDLAIVAKCHLDAEEHKSLAIEQTRNLQSHFYQISTKPFTRLTYTSALQLLASLHHSSPTSVSAPPKWGEGISTEHEKLLAQHFNGPVFVTRYPKSLKPFYMLPTPSEITLQETHSPEGETVECFDLLFPAWGEMAGGSLREHRLPNLLHTINRLGMKKENYDWYLDLRKYGSVPHGGWGMGWERWVGWVTGLNNIRDVVAFPRWKGHCKY
ncbi:asparagine-tRNA ligase [Cryptococcus depauperatus CBS 7841]|uniref:asparagine--tRNA ligase n=1 Tax=Cryptococcus depauperatus CBS 7841 TaxID=1295531 RepID=A0A1E3J1V4_9TREE|nr:asparagine-tRNA ligase [Cryptococcus depauperatus CBS 7841]